MTNRGGEPQKEKKVETMTQHSADNPMAGEGMTDHAHAVCDYLIRNSGTPGYRIKITGEHSGALDVEVGGGIVLYATPGWEGDPVVAVQILTDEEAEMGLTGTCVDLEPIRPWTGDIAEDARIYCETLAGLRLPKGCRLTVRKGKRSKQQADETKVYVEVEGLFGLDKTPPMRHSLGALPARNG